MQSPIIHQQIITATDRLREMHRSMLTHSTSIAPAEMEAFIAEIRKVYELSLQLNYYNALQLLNEIQVTPRPDLAYQPVKNENPVPAPIPVPVPAPEKLTPPPVAEVKPEIKKEEVSSTPVEVPAPHEHISMDKLMADISNQKPQENIVKKGSSDLHEMYEASATLANQFEEHETLGDRIATKNTVSTVSEKINRNPVKDLRVSIGLNEKFQFINQLFSGDSGKYNFSIEYLNNCGSNEVAQEYLRNISTQYNWEEHAASATVFVDLVERRYISA
jgi:hypothetical protein